MGILKAKEPMIPKDASFHPLVEGLQHAVCPDGTFHPVPLCGPDFSRLFSLFRHCHEFPFIQYSLLTSTFLRPFAPRQLPRFFANMDALTPARLALRTHTRGSEHQPFSGQVFPGSLDAHFHAFSLQPPDAPCHRFYAAHPA